MSVGDLLLEPHRWKSRFWSAGWQKAERSREVIEPATGAVLTRVGMAGAAEIRQAAISARSAQPSWAQLNFDAKAKILRAAADLLEAQAPAITTWITRETGSVPAKSQFEVHISLRCLREAASMPSQPQGLVLPSLDGRLSLARRTPLGVVGVITPFNFPLYLSMRALAPALAVGNTVVLKPDPRTPVSGGLLIARLFEEAGLPVDVLHVLPGEAEAGEALCTDPQVAMIQFTGSSATGRRIGALAGAHLKKLSLELGGKNSLIVLEDADLDVAASNAAWSAYLHQGQICMASGRILAHRQIAADLIERLSTKAQQLGVGDPSREAVALGPLISERQLQRAHAIVTDSVSAGARLKAGGTYEKLFYRPTVLSEVRPGMRVFEEETFAPVVAVTTFDTDEEAVTLANQTDYGLSAGILSRSVERALALGAQLRTGLLHINDQTVNDDVLNPFGGKGGSGNGTSIGGPANWDEFTQWQWLTIKQSATAYPF